MFFIKQPQPKRTEEKMSEETVQPNQVIEFCMDTSISLEARVKFDLIRESLADIKLSKDSWYHVIFVDKKNNLIICVSDNIIRNPACARFQSRVDLFQADVEREIIHILSEFWRKRSELIRKQLNEAEQCYFIFADKGRRPV